MDGEIPSSTLMMEKQFVLEQMKTTTIPNIKFIFFVMKNLLIVTSIFNDSLPTALVLGSFRFRILKTAGWRPEIFQNSSKITKFAAGLESNSEILERPRKKKYQALCFSGAFPKIGFGKLVQRLNLIASKDTLELFWGPMTAN